MTSPKIFRKKRIEWDLPKMLGWEYYDDHFNGLYARTWDIGKLHIIANATELAIWGFRIGRNWTVELDGFWPGFEFSFGWIYVAINGWGVPVQEIQ